MLVRLSISTHHHNILPKQVESVIFVARCESSGTGTLSSSSSDTGQVTDSETDGAAIHNGSIPKKEPKIIHVCQVRY